MATEFNIITPKLQMWIEKQKMFFVSTAPLAANGFVNCSPKGLDSFRILNDTSVAYLDLTGSGVETIAHIKENQRITIMFCAFEGPPKIVRLQGKGEVFEVGSPKFNELKSKFPTYSGIRSIIKINCTRISDSCGYAVPKYEYKGQRDVLLKWADRKGVEGIKAYQIQKNAKSLDGLIGLET